MKKRKTIIFTGLLITAGLIFYLVFATRKSLDISYAYPRFDGWGCLNEPVDNFTDKVWQYKSPLVYKTSDDKVEIFLRNKFGANGETHTVQVRVISPNDANYFADGVLQRDKFLYIYYPTDFDNQQDLQPGLYTYEWKVDGKFVLCSGFIVEPSPRNKPSYKYEISRYGIQYLPSFLGKVDCDTVRIAGQVHNNVVLFDDAIKDLKIQLSGNGINMNSITGSKKEYGRGGYEFVLPEEASNTIYYLQVFDYENRVVSAKTPVKIFTGCDKNLIWVNFEQVVFGQ